VLAGTAAFGARADAGRDLAATVGSEVFLGDCFDICLPFVAFGGSIMSSISNLGRRAGKELVPRSRRSRGVAVMVLCARQNVVPGKVPAPEGA
jgi:hypothetical protein